ncbi:MAG: S8 family peptidase [Steroidobacteraceae bacterium]
MRAPAHACALAVLILAAGMSSCAAAAAPTSTIASHHHLIVVTFANEPYRSAARAGTTGRRYSGDGYSIAQGAHDRAKRVASTYSLREVASWPIKALAVHCVVYEIPDSRTVAEVLAALTKDPGITLAQPLQEFHTLTQPEPAGAYNDPLYALQTNLVSLGISAAHERSQGAGVRIALIDTGVDSKHPDLRDRITATRSFIESHPAPASAYRHGTAMAGLIAAVANNHLGMVGIAPLAQIEVFEACWQLKPDADEAACDTFTLAKALAAALEARLPLINLSIAGPPDPLLTALVRTGLRRGVIFVGSAADAADAFPTNIEGVIGVSNSEREHAPGTLAAPATHILTLRPGGEYDFESGTSVAAAEITGVIALLLSANTHLGTDAIVSLLKETSGHGVSGAGDAASIDVAAALAKLDADRPNGRMAAARPAPARPVH